MIFRAVYYSHSNLSNYTEKHMLKYSSSARRFDVSFFIINFTRDVVTIVYIFLCGRFGVATKIVSRKSSETKHAFKILF